MARELEWCFHKADGENEANLQDGNDEYPAKNHGCLLSCIAAFW